MLGGDEAQRGRIVAWREGLGLLGVISGIGGARGTWAWAPPACWWPWPWAGGPGARACACRFGHCTHTGVGARCQLRAEARTPSLSSRRHHGVGLAALPTRQLLCPAGGIYGQRHCQCGTGDADFVFVQDRLQAPESTAAASSAATSCARRLVFLAGCGWCGASDWPVPGV